VGARIGGDLLLKRVDLKKGDNFRKGRLELTCI